MATDEEKARNQRLREEAMAAKVARKTRSEARAEATYQPRAQDVAQTFGGLSGGAAQALMGRKKRIDEALGE